jgi:ADP-ribosylglycohydrolase
MPGGGPFMLQPGQITDDSELALHMLAGLLAYDNKISLDKQLHTLLVSIAK